jgi:hypothetical protein
MNMALQSSPNSKSPSASAGHKRVCLMKLGGEAGAIELVGIQAPGGWAFRVETDESPLSSLLDEDDQIEIPERPWVATWREALKQLDCYPWHQLYVLHVAQDFRGKVFKALKAREKKGLEIPWIDWHPALGAGVE